MELSVEPVDDIDETELPRDITAPEFVLYGGKGGVGKTTMAAATALASAHDETQTLVVSTDPAHSLSDTLDTDIPAEPTRLREDIPLYGAELDPDAALAQSPFGTGAMTEGPLGQLFEDEPTQMQGMIPGADEAAAISVLADLFYDARFERVVVDTAPTGHTLRLLELPELLDSMMGRLLSLRERVQGLFGGEDTTAEIQEFASRIERLRTVLRDPSRTDFRAVMVPEELSIRETERLLDQLAAFDIPVGTVVVNRVMQDPEEVFDTEGTFVAPNHTDCAFCERRWQVQQGALTSAQNIFRGHEVRRVPLFAAEVRGERLLRAVAACLDA